MFEPEADLTGLSDRAHFIKEFKAFTGKTRQEDAQNPGNPEEPGRRILFNRTAAPDG
ncbi:MAG TPA: hypothetical protein VKE49_07720 [Myxococcaceae bacterium]|nr:hypothetical protein [Myxococcaceae bacterium]